MKSRLLGGAAAVVLALIGAVLVFSYTQAADQRAMQDLNPTDVLVVQEAVPAGTPVGSLTESVAVESQPAGAVPNSALENLDDSAGKVTSVDLIPGEHLLGGKLIDPAKLQTPGSVPVPEGLQEITFSLEPQRVAGGKITAGDTVGVFASFEAGALDDEPEEATTQLVFHKVLVTALQRSEAGAEEPVDNQALPAGTMLVTVAVDDVDASKIIFSNEFGRIWLSKEPADATESAPTPIQKSEVYQ